MSPVAIDYESFHFGLCLRMALAWATAILLLLDTPRSFGQPQPDGVDHCVFNGEIYSNILDLRVDSSGDVTVFHKGGAFKAHPGDLSTDFLKSWGINPAPQNAAIPNNANSSNKPWVSDLETGLSPVPFPYDLSQSKRQNKTFFQILFPRVKEFLQRHSEARQPLEDAFRDAATNASIRLYHFYTEDFTVPWAFNLGTPASSNTTRDFMIYVRGNCFPVDETLAIFFELINFQCQDNVDTLDQQAMRGRIGREDYAVGIAKEEWNAYLKSHTFVNQLKLSNEEIKNSGTYNQYSGKPMSFDAFISQSKEDASKNPGSYLGRYETQYDTLKASYDSQVKTNSVMPTKSEPHNSDFLKSWRVTEYPPSTDSAKQSGTKFLDGRSFSPNLRGFIQSHPEANPILADVFAKRATPFHFLNLFYCNGGDTDMLAYYYWMDADYLVVVVPENQKPVDEFIEIVFELVSSDRDLQWKEICEQAAVGRIGREDFAAAMIKEQFPAYAKAWSFFSQLHLSRQEILDSVYYQHFADAPQDLPTFMSCMKEASAKGRDHFKEFEVMYDALVHSAHSHQH